MNNEPVAWRCKKFYENQDGWFYNENALGEPLYTNPVIGDLTDEEITAMWYEPTLRYDPVAFARAILRKAQEKCTK